MLCQVHHHPVPLGPISSGRFSPEGLVVTDPAGLLAEVGRPGAAPCVELVAGGVQTAGEGTIQDPAGSAIGTGTRPRGGGASGAIYAVFGDLEPIPAIAPGAAVFNASTGPGRRVLHSHSPRLAGRPDRAEDRREVLQALATTYASAMEAVAARQRATGGENGPLNLVPVSGGIYAGAFRNPRVSPRGHLDPSWTLTAIALARASLEEAGETLPPLRLFYFDPAVFAAATALLARTW